MSIRRLLSTIVFVFAFVLLFAVVRTLKWLFPSAPPMRPLSASAA